MNATITWNANGESDLAGYKVYHGNAPGVYYEAIDVVAPTVTKAFVGLYDWTPHYFAVTAYDNASPANESDPSSEVSKQIYFRKQTVLMGGASIG